MKKQFSILCLLTFSTLALGLENTGLQFGSNFENFLSMHNCQVLENCTVPSRGDIQIARSAFLAQETARIELINKAEENAGKLVQQLAQIGNAYSAKLNTSKLFLDLSAGCAAKVKAQDYDRERKLIGASSLFLAKLQTLEQRLVAIDDMINGSENPDVRRGLELAKKETYKTARVDLVKDQQTLQILKNNYEGKPYEADSVYPCYRVRADLKYYVPQMYTPECGDSTYTMPRLITVYPISIDEYQINALENSALLALVLDGIGEISKPMTFHCPERNRFASLHYLYDPEKNLVINEWKFDRSVTVPGSDGDLAFHLRKRRVNAAGTEDILKEIRIALSKTH